MATGFTWQQKCCSQQRSFWSGVDFELEDGTISPQTNATSWAPCENQQTTVTVTGEATRMVVFVSIVLLQREHVATWTIMLQTMRAFDE